MELAATLGMLSAHNPHEMAGAQGPKPVKPTALSSRDTTDASGEASVETLMARYVAGDAPAFDELYRRVSPKLFGYLLRLTKHRERAEDLLQITFTKMHRARASYLQGAPLLPWLLAIARRSFYDEVRAGKSRREDLSHDGTLPEPKQVEDEVPLDISDALEQALDALPEAYREAIQLTKITGLSMAEAATVLGTTPTAMKLRVHRGYKALRDTLEKYGDHGDNP